MHFFAIARCATCIKKQLCRLTWLVSPNVSTSIVILPSVYYAFEIIMLGRIFFFIKTFSFSTPAVINLLQKSIKKITGCETINR